MGAFFLIASVKRAPLTLGVLTRAIWALKPLSHDANRLPSLPDKIMLVKLYTMWIILVWNMLISLH